MIEAYVELVRKGLKTIEEVPEVIREQVEDLLTKLA